MQGFTHNCKEIGDLFDQANILVKTINVARMAMLKGNDNQALLNYNQLACINSTSVDRKQICYNNIGCIHLRMKNKKMPTKYLEEAIEMLRLDKENKNSQETNKLILGTRSYNLALGYSRLLKTINK